MSLIDMHIHSTLSDGELTPLQILNCCKERNINIISITDHDNLIGTSIAVKENPYSDLTVIPGIELSAKYKSGQLHILGYNISLENSALNNITTLIIRDNINRIKSLLSLLYNNYNIKFKDEDIECLFSKEGNIGRPEVAKLCIKYGYCDTVANAFKLFFKPLNGIIKHEIELSDLECIKYIKDAGGIVSLAHPITLKKSDDELELYLKYLKEHGLDAVEVYHSSHTAEYSKKLIILTSKYNLLQSGGSDYHGPVVKPDISLGTGKNNNLNITSLSILSKIGG